MTVKELFDFVTDPTIVEENMEQCLNTISDKIADRNLDELTEQEKIDEEVFKQAFIPKRLGEVYDVERDIFNMKNKTSTDEDLIYKTITGLDTNLNVQQTPSMLKDAENTGESTNSDVESENESSDSESDADETEAFKSSARPKNETLEEKKARKKAIKEAAAEKRKTKVKKYIKKKKEKQYSKNKK